MRELTDVVDSGVMSRFGGTKVGQFEYEFATNLPRFTVKIRQGRHYISAEKLAIEGGKPVRNKPLPDGNKIGEEAFRELADVVDSGVMSRFGGTKVGQFEYEFAESYGAKCDIASASSTAGLRIAIGMLIPHCVMRSTYKV